MKKLKFLQIGLGSMGKRRIRNLLYNKISVDNIRGFDLDKKRQTEIKEIYNIDVYSDFKKAINDFDPNVFIISTPPDKHDKYFLYAAKNKKHFFVEPTTTDKGYLMLHKLLDDDSVAAPSCTWIHHPAIQKIQKIINEGQIGKILSFQYHMGQYLPDWHPWEDYRTVYFAQKKTGACREMLPFELIWISNIIGSEPQSISGFTAKNSELDMDADDIYVANIKFKNNVIGNIMIDAISRTPFRTLRLIGSLGVIDWDWKNNVIKLYSVKSKKTKTIKLTAGKQEVGYITTEDMYNKEIGDFLKAVTGKIKFPHTFSRNHHILKTLFALEKSHNKQIII